MQIRIDRRLLANIDWVTLGIVLLISLIGIATIFSATRPLPGEARPPYFIKQFYWLLVGLAALGLTVLVDYSRLNRAAYHLYGVGIVLLVAVLLAGRMGLGAQRWLNLGPVSFQPSELFKLALILALARYMSLRKKRLSMGEVALAGILLVALPLALVAKQPDLGTAVVLCLLFLLMAIGKSVHRRAIVMAFIFVAVSAPFVGTIAWDKLKGYQKKRIVAFVKPSADPEGIGYHITQSKVAIGSGGVLGKGYLKGTQGPLRFLPEKHTDFIFSIYAEEWGFLGSLFLLGAYLALILRGLSTAAKAKDDFGRLVALGVTFMFSVYCFVNIGMTLGLMPVVGLPLPFMSYGGTALVTNFIAAGLLINVRTRRFELFF